VRTGLACGAATVNPAPGHDRPGELGSAAQAKPQDESHPGKHHHELHCEPDRQPEPLRLQHRPTPSHRGDPWTGSCHTGRAPGLAAGRSKVRADGAGRAALPPTSPPAADGAPTAVVGGRDRPRLRRRVREPCTRTRTGRLPARWAATWPPSGSRALRVPAGPPAAALDPAVVQTARRYRSPGAAEDPSPPGRQPEEVPSPDLPADTAGRTSAPGAQEGMSWPPTTPSP
jgi:hypothetical protein